MDQADEKSVIHTPHDAGCGCFLVEGYVSYIGQCVYKTHVEASACRYPALLRQLSLAMEVIRTDRDFVAELEQKDKALASWQANMEEWQRIDRENRQEIERLRKALHRARPYPTD